MNINLDDKYLIDFLENLLNIPSPTGDADKAIDYVKNEFDKLGLETYKTNKRALVATLKGQKEEAITFSGHVDTLGLMVKEIKQNGRVKVSKVGGFPMSTIEGNYVNISTEENGLISGTVLLENSSTHVNRKVDTTERNEENIEIRLDELVYSKEDTKKLGIQIGDFIYINPNVRITKNGYINSRHLDDKAGVCTILGICKYFVDNKIIPPYTLNFFISNYEEVGHGSAAAIPTNTKYFIAVDMAAMGDGQNSREECTNICVKDSSGPYDINIKRNLISAAKKHNIDYKLDIYPYYGSDASAMQSAGNDIPAGLIGPGVDNSHAFERTHINGILNTSKLGIGFIYEI